MLQGQGTKVCMFYEIFVSNVTFNQEYKYFFSTLKLNCSPGQIIFQEKK